MMLECLELEPPKEDLHKKHSRMLSISNILYLHLPCGTFFRRLLQKAEILVVLVKKSVFAKNAVVKNVSPCGRVMSPLGRVMSPFGRATSPLQNHIFKIIWKISKNAVPHKKGCSFGKPIFRAKGRHLAPFWRCRYPTIIRNMITYRPRLCKAHPKSSRAGCRDPSSWSQDAERPRPKPRQRDDLSSYPLVN